MCIPPKCHLSPLKWERFTLKNTNSLEKTLMRGKIEAMRRRGWQSMRRLNGITKSTGMSGRKLWEIVKDKSQHAQSMGWQRVRHNLSNEQQRQASIPETTAQQMAEVNAIWMALLDKNRGLQCLTESWDPYPLSLSLMYGCQFNSDQLSHSVMSNSLWPHGLQHTRLPCPSWIPRAYSNSCPLSRWCHPTISSSVIPSSSCLQFPSIRVFLNELVLHIRWPKYWSFSFNINPCNEYSGMVSFRMDWLDILAVEGIFKSFLQHHSSKASILQHSAFFIVQLSHLYVTNGKTIALPRWTLLAK